MSVTPFMADRRNRRARRCGSSVSESASNLLLREAELAMAESKKPSSPRRSLSAYRRQAEVCRRCDLWKHATRTVFGDGSAGARIMLVGEQPGDAEDVAGKP